MSYYVYILTNEFNSVFYVGVTNDICRRVAEHTEETAEGFTKKYHTHKLVYYEEYTEISQAIAREKQLKGWTRNKKVALTLSINPDMKDLFRQ